VFWGCFLRCLQCMIYLEDKLKGLIKRGIMLQSMEGFVDNQRVCVELG
jgi:hypothetical protein